MLGVEFIPWHIQWNFGLACEALELGEQRPVLWLSPGFDSTFVQGLALIGDDEVEIDVDGVAEALATWAGAIRIVEGKQARLGLIVAANARLAIEAVGKKPTSK